MIRRILKLLNLDFQENQRPIALSCFISIAMHSYFGPVLCKTAISELPAQWLSVETIWCCVSSLVVGMAWKGRFRDVALRRFVVFAVAESVAGLVLGLYLAFVGWNVWVYSIFSLIYISMVSFTISKCIMAFKSRLWSEKARETYDNTDSIVRNIGLLVGSLAAIAFCPSLKLALVLFGISCVVDDLGWILTYLRVGKSLEESFG